MKAWWILKAIKMTILFLLFGAVMSYLVMAFWNWLMPAVFGLGLITFWQALGILVLSKLLFGFGRGGWGYQRHYGAHWKHYGSGMWKNKMEEKLKAMSPEEREKFREEWKRKCGWSYQEAAAEKSSEPRKQ